jgi:serine/threonine-protein kinase TNNI3K
MAQKRQQITSFKSIQLLKEQTLGIGSYGKVCKAKCDDLLCAAKLIHETLFDPTAQQLIGPQREHRLPIRRFEQECEFLSTIRHPNIIQYLGICQDPDTGLPALLMELMDECLTHFLESSPQPIHYYIQVNVCHDISLALSFVHVTLMVWSTEISPVTTCC